jgi:NitT/TauT family transport system substrate-binding protein
LGDALTSGQVSAAVLIEPLVAQLQNQAVKLTILLDLRTAQGVVEGIGVSEFPGPVLSATDEWIGSNRSTCERLTRAMRRTLLWMSSHTASQIASRIPVEFRQPDEATYINALVASLPAFSVNGNVAPASLAALRQVIEYSAGGAAPTLSGEDVFTSEFLDLAPVAVSPQPVHRIERGDLVALR